MAEPNEHIKQYSAVDIERYYTGKMSAQEMHQLEKAALDDPFLADALEGYQYTAHPAEDTIELRKSLLSQLGRAKVVVLPKRSDTKRILKIAAMFIFIAGTAWIVYQFGFTKTDRDIAIRTDAIKENTNATDSTQILITPNTEAAETEAKTESLKQAEQLNHSSSTEKTLDGSTANKKVRLSSAPASTEARDLEMERNNVNNRTSEATTELNEVVVSPSAPDTSNAPMATFRYDTQRNIAANNDNVIVMQRAKDSNVQTIVLGKSRSDSAGRRRSTITFEDVEPEKGQGYYDDYVIQNLNIPEELKIKNTSGEVQLSFDVNELGDAVNIKVEKSLCEDCDKEAVRLLKEGPKWVKKKSKKGKVRIRF